VCLAQCDNCSPQSDPRVGLFEYPTHDVVEVRLSDTQVGNVTPKKEVILWPVEA